MNTFRAVPEGQSRIVQRIRDGLASDGRQFPNGRLTGMEGPLLSAGASGFGSHAVRIPRGVTLLCRSLLLLALSLFSVLWQSRAGTWAVLSNAPPAGVDLMLLLSDGTVMAHQLG